MGFFDFFQKRLALRGVQERSRKASENKIAKYKGKPLRVFVRDVFNISGVGLIVVGYVDSGVLYVGQEVIVMPSGIKTKVKNMEISRRPANHAKPGDIVIFCLEKISKNDIKRGCVIEDWKNLS